MGFAFIPNQGGTWTVDTELPAAAALSDATPNPTAPMVGAALMVYNVGTNQWERVIDPGYADGTVGRQILAVGSMLYKGTTSTFLMSQWAGPSDGMAWVSSPGATSWGMVWNGASWDMVRTANGAAGTSGTGLLGAGTMVFDATNWQKYQPIAGTHANLWNNAATGAGGTSASIEIRYCPHVSVFGNTSGATTFTVQMSQDNVNFYDSGTTNAPAGAGNFGFSFDNGARYIRVKSSNNVTVTATAAGKN